MSEPKSQVVDLNVKQTLDPIAVASNTLARDLVAALLEELRGIPDHWSRLSEDVQKKSLERVKDRVKSAVDQAVFHLARGTYPAIPATLDYVANRKGITAGLSIATDALCRHELFDARGQRVLVVVADPAKWMEKIDEIKAQADQRDLFDPDANYDPKRDQPGYRRDQDPFAPAGPTWADLKKSFASPPSDTSNPGADELARCMLVQDRLAAVDVLVDLEAIKLWTDEQVTAAGEWADAYALDPANCPILKPDFLPDPIDNQPGDDAP